MALDQGGGSYKKKDVKTQARIVSSKRNARAEVKPPVKTATTQPSKQKNVREQSNINAGVKKHIADISAGAEKYIVPYEAPKNSIGSVAYNPWLGARGKYADVVTDSEWAEMPQQLKQKYNMGYIKVPEPQKTEYYYEDQPRKKTYYGGGGGGGGGYTPPAPPAAPDVKIRTAAGLRRSPYWESEDPYASVFEPRFVVLGNQNAW